MGRLENKVAVVTGGSSNPSLGRSMSIAFAKEGAKVILTDVDILGGKEVEDEILNSDGEAVYIEHDVTSAEGWAEVRNKTLEKYKKIDILVNNAGIAIIKPFEETPEEEWDTALKDYLNFIFYGCKIFFPLIGSKKGGP